jgi:hypothetical protein
MTRQLISTAGQPPIRPPHAKRPPQSGLVQVAFSETGFCPRSENPYAQAPLSP